MSSKNSKNRTFFSTGISLQILTLMYHGGMTTISVESINGLIKREKQVYAYKVINKPSASIISGIEEWGPFEVITSSNNGRSEIGISSGAGIIINNNTIIDNVDIILEGKISTNNSDKNNTIINNMRISTEYKINDGIFMDNVHANYLTISCPYSIGKITNSELSNFTLTTSFVPSDAAESNLFNVSGNIFNERAVFIYNYYISASYQSEHLLDTIEPLYIRNNLFLENISIYGSGTDPRIYKYVESDTGSGPWVYDYDKVYYSKCFKYNTISLYNTNMNSFSSGIYGNRTPNIDLSENYWGTTDTSLIDELIIDSNDSLLIDYTVNYKPILTQNHPLTPLLE